VYENRVLRRLFGPKGQGNRGVRQLNNEELNSASDHIEENKLDEACYTYDGEERCIQGFGGEI